MTTAAVAPPGKRRGYFAILSLGALGVVYGDIGTSPLYAVREAFFGPFGVATTPENVLGILSLIFWSLILVVSIKYLVFVLRADNEGEGGILALMALIHPEHARAEDAETKKHMGPRRFILVSLGLFGAALLYGDGMITPAISVLSAVEGLDIAQPGLGRFVVPISVAILVGLFLMQRHGTARVGALFGPITFVWFVVISFLGLRAIFIEPSVLAALNPAHAILFLVNQRLAGFLALGAVFLAVTGAEALYADMGHFGAGPIRVTWFAMVLPALVLNYFGQGALLLSNPDAAHNPFYRLAPDWALVPLVILATLATIIASQAIISGAFSLTVQAVQLGYAPRVAVRHTSEREIGQVYVPFVNWTLMIATVLLVLAFQSSSRLAAAYGIAVTSTMMITTILFFVVAREKWHWPWWAATIVTVGFLAVETAFFAANLVKIVEGGWFPLLVALGVFTLMTTWRQGRRALAARLKTTAVPLDKFLDDLKERSPTRVRGIAIYMTGNPSIAPPALIKNLEHNRVLHFRVVLMSVTTEDFPYVPREQRVTLKTFPNGIYRVVARYGFMEQPDAIEVLRILKEERGLNLPIRETTFFLGRDRLVPARRHRSMPFWREQLFAFMSRNAQQATAYFRIPPDRVIEVGASVEL